MSSSSSNLDNGNNNEDERSKRRRLRKSLRILNDQMMDDAEVLFHFICFEF